MRTGSPFFRLFRLRYQKVFGTRLARLVWLVPGAHALRRTVEDLSGFEGRSTADHCSLLCVKGTRAGNRLAPSTVKANA